MFSVVFLIIYTLLQYIEGNDLFGYAVITMVKTNIVWDIISAFVFIAMAMLFSSLCDLTRNLATKSIVVSILFVGIGLAVVHSFPMYFTDRIFIVVLSWSLCVKTISFFKDSH